MQTRTEKLGTATTHNSSLAKVAVQCSAVRQLAEANQTLVLRINPDSYRDGKNRQLLLAVNRYGQFL